MLDENQMQENETNTASTEVEAQDQGQEGQNTSDAAVEQPQGEGGQNKAAEEKKPQTPWFQTRIDKLTAEKYEKAREVENLRAELAAARNTGRVAEGAAPEAANGAPTTQAEIERLADQKARQITAEQRFNEACNSVYTKGTEEYTDFKDAVATLNMVGVTTPEFLSIVTDMPEAHKILHHLGNNPDDAARIAGLSPTKQAYELARIEASLGVKKSVPISKAPAPISTIDGRGKAMAALDDPKIPTDKWMELRARELEKRPRAR